MANDRCLKCGLLRPPGAGIQAIHLGENECIRALNAALVRQREVASTLAFDLSVRYLTVLEQLAAAPDVGVPYLTHQVDPETGRPTMGKVEMAKVSGVFAAIWKRFAEMGDWSPMQELRDRIAELEAELALRPPAAPPPGP